jgi:hypothetical protein
MNTTGKIVAGLCIFSIPFMGCYTSSMIDLTGAEKEKGYSDNIEMVVTKYGATYQFDRPAKVDSNAVVGMAAVPGSKDLKTNRVSIPLSDVAKVRVGEFDATTTAIVSGSVIAAVALIVAAAISGIHIGY